MGLTHCNFITVHPGHLTTNKARGFPSYHHHCWFWRLNDEIDIISIFTMTRFQSCWTLPSPPTCDTWMTTRCTWAPSSCTRPCHTQGDDVNDNTDLRFVKKIYTTGFLGQKFYTLKVFKLGLFLLKKKQCKCIWVDFLLKFNWVCKVSTVSVQNHTWRV